MKFLEKNELANYHFQKEFLKPFEYIMQNQSSEKIRDIVIRCMSNMILARAQNIRSGWKSIFVVFTIAASDRIETIVRLAFDMLQEIIHRYFYLIVDSFFVDCVNCLVAYANGHLYIDVCLKAIESLNFCARELAEGKVISIASSSSDSQSGVMFSENDKHLALWFPILTGMSSVVAHAHIDVRTSALRTLFHILSDYGQKFSVGFWQLIFRGVLLPIFDNVRYASGGDLLHEDNEWLTTTCLLALNSLIGLFSDFFGLISFLLCDLLNLLVSCILSENESLARIGVTCFLQMVMANALKFNEEMWAMVCGRLHQMIQHNTARDLINSAEKIIDSNNTTNINNNNSSSNNDDDDSNSYDSSHLSAVEDSLNNTDGQVTEGSNTTMNPSSISVVKNTPNIHNESIQETAKITVETMDVPLPESVDIQETNENLSVNSCSSPTTSLSCTSSNTDNASLSDFSPKSSSNDDKLPASVTTIISSSNEISPGNISSVSVSPKRSSSLTPSKVSFGIAQLLKISKSKCTIQLGLIETLNEIAFTHYSSLSTVHLVELLDALEESFHLSRTIGTNMLLKPKLEKTGLPELFVRQETSAISCFVRVLLRMFSETVKDAQRRAELAEERMFPIIREVLEDFIKRFTSRSSSSVENADSRRALSAYAPIVIQILMGTLDFSDSQFTKHLPTLYPLLTELILSDNKDVREQLKIAFTRVGHLKEIFEDSAKSR